MNVDRTLIIAADLYKARIWQSVDAADWQARCLQELELRLPSRSAADRRKAWKRTCALFSDAAKAIYDGADLEQARSKLIRRHPGFSRSNYDAAISQALQDSRH